MKLHVTVTDERLPMPDPMRRGNEKEPYTVTELTAEGSPDLVAGHLRAIADSLSPKKPALRDAAPRMERAR